MRRKRIISIYWLLNGKKTLSNYLFRQKISIFSLSEDNLNAEEEKFEEEKKGKEIKGKEIIRQMEEAGSMSFLASQKITYNIIFCRDIFGVISGHENFRPRNTYFLPIVAITLLWPL